MKRTNSCVGSGATAHFQSAHYNFADWKRAVAPLPILLLAVALSIAPALAVDHDNIDANHPLDFDDAETIAYRERALEFGGALGLGDGNVKVGGDVEFLSGFARNWHLNIGASPGYDRRFDAGEVEIGVQHNFNRETLGTPAFGARIDAILPTARDSSGVDFRLRGIASRKFGRYGRLHFNADLEINNSPNAGERRTLPGVIVGYSTPIGFPKRFNRTLVAQVGYRAAPEKGDYGLVNIGIGLRQQVTPRSVFDIGIKSDLVGSGDDRENLRLIAGYSTAF